MTAAELRVALIEAMHSKGRDALDRRMLNDQQIQLAYAMKSAPEKLADCVRDSRDVLRWYGGQA